MAQTTQKSKVKSPPSAKASGGKQNLSKPVRQAQGKSFGSAQGKPVSSMAELMAKVGSSLQVLQKGQTVEGTIKKLTPQEILMDIGAKGDGLVIEFDRQKLDNLLANLKVGDVVRATVISSESEEGFPVLSLRHTLDDIIFGRLEEKYKTSQELDVAVKETTRGGYFVETTEGVRGFLPTSQTFGNDIIGHNIKVGIIEFDRGGKKVIFSQKILSYLVDIEKIKEYVKPNQVISVTVASITPYGIFVSFSPKKDILIEGFIHISEVAYGRVENIEKMYKQKDNLEAKVLNIDSESKRLNLSIKRLATDSYEDAKNKYKMDDKISAKILDVRSRGVTVEIEVGVLGFIPQDKIPQGIEYKVGDSVEAVVSGFDDRKRAIGLSPVLKAVPVGYR